MRISIIVEGQTEKAFKAQLVRFLETVEGLRGRMPYLDFVPEDHRIATGKKLRDLVFRLLNDRRNPSDAVIALTDVYTGTNEFRDAEDAKRKMREWVGDESRFYPHAAQHDFEAWLLPYWDRIKALTNRTDSKPYNKTPETVNHNRPPAKVLSEMFLNTRPPQKKQNYKKTVHIGKILNGQDLRISIAECPELKSFINTILRLSGAEEIA